MPTDNLYTVKVTRAGWFDFEGFGRPFEGWYTIPQEVGGWHSAGRSLTWPGARRKARRKARSRERYLSGDGLSGCGRAIRGEPCAAEPCCRDSQSGGVVTEASRDAR